MNNVILIGYLGNDAETRKTRNDSTLTTLSLATQRTWKDRESGERQSQTTWHRLVIFGRLAEYAATLTKGAHLQIAEMLGLTERKFVQLSRAITASEVIRFDDIPDFISRRFA